MDNSKWAFAPDAPEWPVNARGEKERAVLLTSTFDSTADADMLISLLAAYRIPAEVAVRVYRIHGEQAMELVQENPYLLAKPQFGASFAGADMLAL